jgi:hypothetical protein
MLALNIYCLNNVGETNRDVIFIGNKISTYVSEQF